MARSRTIKPDFFRHEDVASISPLARLLFIGLWTLADCDGYVEERTRKWKMDILPGDDCSTADLLAELLEIGVVTHTELEKDGRNVLLIPKFCKHQRIHPKESSLFEASNEPELAGTSSGQSVSSPPRAGARARKKKAEGKKEEKKKEEGRKTRACAKLTPDQLVAIYAETLPELPQPNLPLNDGIQKQLLAAIKRDGDDPTNWRTYFASIRSMPFLMGQKTDWRASITWLTGPKNRAKVLAGEYSDHSAPLKIDPQSTRMVAGMTHFVESDWENK